MTTAIQQIPTRTTTELIAEMQFRANTMPEIVSLSYDFESFMELYDENFSEGSEKEVRNEQRNRRKQVHCQGIS